MPRSQPLRPLHRSDAPSHLGPGHSGPATALGTWRIAVTGASGLLGSALRPELAGHGHAILPLVRREPEHADEIRWDPRSGAIDLHGLEGVDAVVHLAGETIGGGRWTAARKAAIFDSRVRGTETLCRALAALAHRPRVLVMASATGWYGNAGERECDESTPAGHGFLADVCQAWEAAADPARQAGIRVVQLRQGVVLSARGGMLARLKLPYMLGLGGPVGSGRQWLPWVALEDWLAMVELALFDEGLVGPLNAVAPRPVRQAQFAEALAHALHRPSGLPLPKALVHLLFGQMGEELLLFGARVRPKRLEQLGFVWKYPQIEAVLRAELGGEMDRVEEVIGA